MGNNKHWTAAENKNIQRQLDAGVMVKDVKVKGRTEGACKRHAPIVCKKRCGKKPWTETENRNILRQLEAGVKAKNIKIKDRTRDACTVQTYLVSKKAGLNKKSWSKTEHLSIKRQLDSGVRVKDLKVKGRTSVACKRQAPKVRENQDKSWTKAENKNIQHQLDANVKIKDVKIKGRTEDACKRQAYRIRKEKIKPTTSHRIANGQSPRWIREEDLKLVAAHFQSKPLEETDLEGRSIGAKNHRIYRLTTQLKTYYDSLVKEIQKKKTKKKPASVKKPMQKLAKAIKQVGKTMARSFNLPQPVPPDEATIENCKVDHEVGNCEKATVGDFGTAIAGDLGIAIAGMYGTAQAGNYGHATAGNYGTATAGEQGKAKVGIGGTAIVGEGGTAMASQSGTATAGNYGKAIAGIDGMAKAGLRGKASAGWNGVAIAGDQGSATVGQGGQAAAGINGTLNFPDGVKFRVTGGVLPNTLYSYPPEGSQLIKVEDSEVEPVPQETEENTQVEKESLGKGDKHPLLNISYAHEQERSSTIVTTVDFEEEPREISTENVGQDSEKNKPSTLDKALQGLCRGYTPDSVPQSLKDYIVLTKYATQVGWKALEILADYSTLCIQNSNSIHTLYIFEKGNLTLKTESKQVIWGVDIKNFDRGLPFPTKISIIENDAKNQVQRPETVVEQDSVEVLQVEDIKLINLQSPTDREVASKAVIEIVKSAGKSGITSSLVVVMCHKKQIYCTRFQVREILKGLIAVSRVKTTGNRRSTVYHWAELDSDELGSDELGSDEFSNELVFFKPGQ